MPESSQLANTFGASDMSSFDTAAVWDKSGVLADSTVARNCDAWKPALA